MALVALAALFALVLLIVTLALPGWIAGRGMALASDALGRAVSIRQAHVEPWRLAVIIDELRIAGVTPDAPPLLTLAQGDVALSLRSLVHGRLVVESMTLTQPDLRLARVGEGRYDIDDLVQRFAAKAGTSEAPTPAPEFAIYNIELSDGRVRFDDRPVQRRHELAALHLSLPFVSTLAADVAVKLRPHLSGRLDGVAFDSRAEALPFEDDVSARLSLKLAGLELAPLAAYLPERLPLRLASGRLDVDLALDFAERPKQLPSVKFSGAVQVHELALTRPDGQPWFGLKRLVLPLTDVQPLRRHFGFGSIQLESPRLRWQPLPESSPQDAGPGTPWQIQLAGLQLSDGRLVLQGLSLDAIELKLGAVSWPITAPALLDASLRVDDASLRAKASLSPQALQATASLQGLAVERLAAWLPLPTGAQWAARLSGTGELELKQPMEAGATDRVQLKLRDLQLGDARLSLGSQPVMTLAVARLNLAEIDTAARSVRLDALQLDAPRAWVARAADGRLNIDALRPQVAPGTSQAGPGWKVQLAALQVDRGGLRWRDAAVPAGVNPVALAIEPLKLQLGPLAWPAVAPLQVQLAAQLAALGGNDRPEAAGAGSLRWKGRASLSPLSFSGQLQAQSLPLQLLNAYLDPAWGLHLQRAELGVKGEFSVAQQPSGWQVSLSGDVLVGPLALLQSRVVDGRQVAGEDLLSWQALQLGGVQLLLNPGAPPRLAAREAVLDDAYARLIINEQGRFNLRDIGPAEAASAAAAASAPASAQPEIAIAGMRVNRGLVDFTDRFVKPGYSARLTELQGSLGAFSSNHPATAPLTVRGKVAGAGLLEIDGQLRPGSPPVMDVQARATDIELAPLSTYAGKYAGYAIEQGRLSARLGYKVEPDGRLAASNQIILNQLSLGERVESADATTLPVRFAVALLKDANGVIEVNLPVSGSLSDPEFSVSGLVWKLTMNLIGKALTSPFSLFTGHDSSEGAHIAFAPANTELSSSERLDRIARTLTDKPGVRLTVTGWADAETELAPLRERRLNAALAALKAPTAEAALKRLYAETPLRTKPRNVLGLVKDLPPAEMRGLLMAADVVDDEILRQLALARAVAVRDALLARGAPSARVFVAAAKLCDGACAEGGRPHVELSLDVH